MKRSPIKRSRKPMQRTAMRRKTRLKARKGGRTGDQARRCSSQLWGACIHALWGQSSALSGPTREPLHAAHLIGKGECPALRYELMNGALLTADEHAMWDGDRGVPAKRAVQAAFGAKYPEWWEWIEVNRNRDRRGMTMDEVEAYLEAALRRAEDRARESEREWEEGF